MSSKGSCRYADGYVETDGDIQCNFFPIDDHQATLGN